MSKTIKDITLTQIALNPTDYFEIQEDAGTSKNVQWSTMTANIAWVLAGETWTYASADSPTFTFTISGDKTSKYSVGMKLKLTQTTVKYFIITAISYASGTGLTTVTVYGGTDYALASATISDPYYSMMRTPYGFPMDPDKWSVILIDTTDRVQSSPGTGTVYNLGSLSIVVPIGIWNLEFQCAFLAYASTNMDAFVALSLSNSSMTDKDLTAIFTESGPGGGGYKTRTMSRSKIINITSKTTYYLVESLTSSGTLYSITLNGVPVNTLIKAKSVYI